MEPPASEEHAMKTLLTVSALGAMLGLAAPALAADPKPAPAASAAATGPVSDVTAAAPDKTRYCVMTEPTTGSRISKRVCQTRGDWLKEGFDPLSRSK
jgi:hypothetical protein